MSTRLPGHLCKNNAEIQRYKHTQWEGNKLHREQHQE